APAQHERGHEQHEQIAVGRQAEAEQPYRDRERDEQADRRTQRRAAIQILSRRAPPCSYGFPSGRLHSPPTRGATPRWLGFGATAPLSTAAPGSTARKV